MVQVLVTVADAATVADGKLYALGAGWIAIQPGAGPSAVAVLVSLTDEAALGEHEWRLELFDEEGVPVEVDGSPLVAGGRFRARPHDPPVPAAAPFNVPIVLNLAPIPLPSGRSFEWRFALDGEHRDEWTAWFATRTATEEDGDEAET